MPVWMNEPLTIVQKTIEALGYWRQLQKANQEPDPYMRAALVASNFFMVHSLIVNRTKKPFNSLLGETCDYDYDGIRIISEQVSHHPPISAYHAETSEFIL
jgi:hypothetical protein